MRLPWNQCLLIALRIALLIALVFSVALFVHYLDPANSGFCSGKSGCEAVRRSGFSYFFGKTYLNLPLFGVVAFTSLLTLTFVQMAKPLRALLIGSAAVFGAVVALVLIALQATVVGAYCWLCMVVDVAALAAGVVGALWITRREVEQFEGLKLWASAAIALLLATSPALLWQFKPPPGVPAGVRALYQPGKINVVEFADFQCPFCRTMHPILQRLNREYGDRVNFHQLHMPLPTHVHAFPAATAAVCAEGRGKGKEMKELLFTHALDEEAPLNHAESLGFDRDEFQKCMDSAKTSKRVYDDMAILNNAGFRGLPTTFIGEQRIVGWRVYPALKEAYEQALSDDSSLKIPTWLFWSLVSISVLVLGVLGKPRSKGLANT